MTAQCHIWIAAGRPEHPYPQEVVDVACATCGVSTGRAVPIQAIETSTTSGHADLFRYGGKYVCQACAWLFSAGKGRPGNFIAYGDRLEYTVISVESVVADKRPWLEVLQEIAALSRATPVAGVMTTDVKPRLWHRTRLATVGAFGLYVHAPDYDVSQWLSFDLHRCLELAELMLEPLRAGYSKASIYHGLLRDYARSSRDPSRALTWESALAALRGQPHFLPALIAAGVPKEGKTDVKTASRPLSDSESAAAGRDQPDQTQPGLF